MSRTRITRSLSAASRALLAFDALINSSMFNAQHTLSNAWRRIDAVSDRLHLSGVPRILVEFACEGLTLGLAGLLVVLTMALPAFQETADEDWLKRGDLAVTFQDRYGVEVGKRGIKHDDADAFRGTARFFYQSGYGDRGPSLFQPFRHRRRRHAPRAYRQCQSFGRRSGRLVDNPAVGQEPVSYQ